MVTHKGRDCKDDLKHMQLDNPKVKLNLLNKKNIFDQLFDPLKNVNLVLLFEELTIAMNLCQTLLC